jgi:anti-sigma B factor antagonist
MLVNAESVEGITVVELPERIVSLNNRAFDKDLAPLMKPNAKMIFDLTQVNRLDSTGLGSIVAWLKRVRNDGGDVKLCGLSQQIRTLFEMVRLHRVFDIFNTRQEAIDSYK